MPNVPLSDRSTEDLQERLSFLLSLLSRSGYLGDELEESMAISEELTKRYRTDPAWIARGLG